MDLGSWLALISGVAGAAVAVYGAVVLVTGRATPADRRAFRRVTDAGRYYLCFGLALTLLVLGGVWNRQDHTIAAFAALAGTVALVGLGVLRYRPGRKG